MSFPEIVRCIVSYSVSIALQEEIAAKPSLKGTHTGSVEVNMNESIPVRICNPTPNNSSCLQYTFW